MANAAIAIVKGEIVALYGRRGWSRLALTMAYNIGIGLILAFMFFQLPAIPQGLHSRLALMAAVRIESTAMAIIWAVDAFPIALRIWMVERSRWPGLNCLVLVLAALLVPLPFFAMCILIKCLIIYPIVGLRCCVDHFLVFYLALLMQRIANMSFGLMLSACTVDLTLNMILAGFGVSFNLLLSGSFYVTATVTWILRWLEFVSASYYTAQMMSQNELNGLPGDHLSPDDQVQFEQVSLWTAFVLMIALSALCVVLAWLFLYLSLIRIKNR